MGCLELDSRILTGSVHAERLRLSRNGVDGQCDQMLELKLPKFSKGCPKTGRSSFNWKSYAFQNTQKTTKYVSYFCKKIYQKDFQKSPKSGHPVVGRLTCLPSFRPRDFLVAIDTEKKESKFPGNGFPKSKKNWTLKERTTKWRRRRRSEKALLRQWNAALVEMFKGLWRISLRMVQSRKVSLGEWELTVKTNKVGGGSQ